MGRLSLCAAVPSTGSADRALWTVLSRLREDVHVTTPERASALSRILPGIIGLLGSKRMFASADRTMRRAREQLVRPQSFAPPRSLERHVDVSIRHENGWPIYTVGPRTGASSRRAVYIHGGAWINEISSFHWRLIADFAASTGTEITVPIYPLVPRTEATAENVVGVIADLAASIVARVGGRNVVLLGDSAGGTIALSVAHLLRDRGVPSPRDLVLISPVIDMRFTDPEIYRIEPSDPWLDVPGPRAAGERWRGDLDITDSRVSPAFGPLAGLGRISLFTGTRDITHADAITLERKAAEEGHPLDVHRAPGMIHVYPLLPIPEGAAAREAIRQVLRRDAPID
jgi:acetyl esterase/lipase